MKNCAFCGTPVNPSDKSTFHRVLGWEQKRDQGGANHIHLRRPLNEYACTPCITGEKQKPRYEQLILPVFLLPTEST